MKKEMEEKALMEYSELLIKKIEKSNTDWKKPWFTEGLGWPVNLQGREYNGMNATMLTLLCEDKGYQIPVFCTFDTMKFMNLVKSNGEWKRKTDKDGNWLPKVSIKEGEKSFPVFLTVFSVEHKDTKKRIKYDEYLTLTESEKQNYNVYPNYRVYRVFNIDQSNLEETRPEMYQKFKESFLKKKEEQASDDYQFVPFEKMREANDWLCPIEEQYQDRAFYSLKEDKITLPERKQFEKGVDFYGTAFHEMAHSTGKQGRLNRFGDKITERGQEELVAELSSALVSLRYGMSKSLESDNCKYLKYWLGEIKENPKFIKNVLMDAKKASHLIIERISNYDTK